MMAGLWVTALAGEARADPPPGERYTVFRVGADLGIARIAGEAWWQLNATGLLRVGAVRLDFAAPLRVDDTVHAVIRWFVIASPLSPGTYHARVRAVRRDIARMRTVAREHELGLRTYKGKVK